MKRRLSILFALLISFGAFAQGNGGYGWPLDIEPPSFSSTYGELRHNHFHAGLDWRTNARTGYELHAIKEGYICRINVSPVGYGNAIYINHPDGTMSVYGHMDRFRSDIAARVREEQYKNQRYRVDFELDPSVFPLEKGEVFGWSGNTGSSGGPHLHMEIRREGGDLPLNYLASGAYPIKDTQKPSINRVGFYAFEDSTGIPVVRRLQMIAGPEKFKGTVSVSEKFYVAIDALDRMEGTNGRLAVERYTVWLDNEKIFEFKVDDVPYSVGRYFTCLVQQGEKGHDLLKTWCVPNNGLAYKINAVNDGIITLEDDAVHTLKIAVADCFGNSSGCSLQVKRNPAIKVYEPAALEGTVAAVWYLPTVFSRDGMTMTMEPASLNASTYIKCERTGFADVAAGIYSDVWTIGNDDIHLQRPFALRLETSQVPEGLKDKAYIARAGSGGASSYAGTTAVEGCLQARCRFGTYFVAVDTTAPVLHPRVLDGASLPANGRFSIEAEDAGSEIATFNVLMDGEWILSQFVKGRIQVYPDNSHKKNRKHRVEVTAEDHCGNASHVSFSVIY